MYQEWMKKYDEITNKSNTTNKNIEYINRKDITDLIYKYSTPKKNGELVITDESLELFFKELLKVIKWGD